MKPTEFKLVKVTWDDAESATERWASLAEVTKDEPTLCVSVGWLIKETDSKIHLAASLVLGESDQVSGHVAIPKPMIKEVLELTIRYFRAKKKVQSSDQQ